MLDLGFETLYSWSMKNSFFFHLGLVPAFGVAPLSACKGPVQVQAEVVDAAGTAVEGVDFRVHLSGKAWKEVKTFTDASGMASFGVEAPTTVRLHRWGSTPCQVDVGSRFLPLPSRHASMKFVVPLSCAFEADLHDESGAPVEDAAGFFQIDVEGYSLADLGLKADTPGHIKGRLPCGPGRAAFYGKGDLAEIHLTGLQFTEGTRMDLTLVPGALLEGTVRGADGVPVSGASVGEAGYAYTRTRKDGTFTVRLDSRTGHTLRFHRALNPKGAVVKTFGVDDWPSRLDVVLGEG